MRETLTPKLTASDRRVLAVLPSAYIGDTDVWTRTDFLTAWQVAEALDTTDVADVLMTLGGCDHLRLAMGLRSRSRKRKVWFRTPEGDEELARGRGENKT